MARDEHLAQFYHSASWDVEKSNETYLITLTFTLVGLAVQTSKFDPAPFFDAAELMGWLSLMASGLIGLRRQRSTVGVLSLATERERVMEKINHVTDLHRADPDGVINASHPLQDYGKSEVHRFKPEEYLQILRQRHRDFEKRVGDLRAKDRQLRRWQMGGFLAGLIMLMIARAWQPLTDLWRVLT